MEFAGEDAEYDRIFAGPFWRMAVELGGGRKKKQKEGEHRIIQLDLFKPTKKKYPLVDFEDLRRDKFVSIDRSGAINTGSGGGGLRLRTVP